MRALVRNANSPESLPANLLMSTSGSDLSNIDPAIASFSAARQALYLRWKNRTGRRDPQVRLLQRYGVDVVLDVGANVGQYAKNLIRRRFGGRIISFEPQPDAYRSLLQNRWGLNSWSSFPFALGSQDTTASMNIAGNSQSSSLHAMLDAHVRSAPDSAYVGQVDVPVKRLDSIAPQCFGPNDRVFLKMDVQGHEHEVIEGAAGCLDRIVGMELELSLVPLYEGQLLWQQAIEAVEAMGFELARMTPGFSDPKSGVMLQADGIFMRRTEVERLLAA